MKKENDEIICALIGMFIGICFTVVFWASTMNDQAAVPDKLLDGICKEKWNNTNAKFEKITDNTLICTESPAGKQIDSTEYTTILKVI